MEGFVNILLLHILQIRKLKLREIKQLTHNQKATHAEALFQTLARHFTTSSVTLISLLLSLCAYLYLQNIYFPLSFFLYSFFPLLIKYFMVNNKIS